MPGDDPVSRDLLLEVVRRGPMLAALLERPMDGRDLEDRLGVARSTRHRNTTTLAERGLVEKSEGEFALTEFGRAVAERVATFEADVASTVRLAPVFEAVSGIEPACPIDALADATVTTSDSGDPFGPLARFVSLVEETDSLRMIDSYAIAPTYIDEIHGRVLDGLETAVVERPEVAADVVESYPAKCVELCASDHLSMRIHDRLPVGLALLDHRVGIGVRDAETGVPRAFVDTDSPAVREWAETVFDGVWNDATVVERFNPQALDEAIRARSE